MIRNALTTLWALLASTLALAQRDGPTDPRRIATELLVEADITTTQREAELRLQQTTRIIAVVSIAAVALIGSLIFSEMYTTMEPAINDTAMATEATNIVGGFGDAMAFVPIVLIVLLAALVISVVRQM